VGQSDSATGPSAHRDLRVAELDGQRLQCPRPRLAVCVPRAVGRVCRGSDRARPRAERGVVWRGRAGRDWHGCAAPGGPASCRRRGGRRRAGSGLRTRQAVRCHSPRDGSTELQAESPDEIPEEGQAGRGRLQHRHLRRRPAAEGPGRGESGGGSRTAAAALQGGRRTRSAAQKSPMSSASCAAAKPSVVAPGSVTSSSGSGSGPTGDAWEAIAAGAPPTLNFKHPGSDLGENVESYYY
jgi:hypothetical protein